MSKGSVLGPFSLPPYTSPLVGLVTRHQCGLHIYADDTQLYMSFSQKDNVKVLKNIEQYVEEVRQWMRQNCLKLNDSKTEFLVIRKEGTKSCQMCSQFV